MRLKKPRKRLKSLTALAAVLLLLSHSFALAQAPSVEIRPQGETPSFLRLEVPSDLARVEDIYEAPPKVDPSLIVHIQNAHGNYDAQLKIRKLMQHLYEHYGFRLFFVEGAVSRLNPDYLKIFSDTRHNREVADALAREGKLTGAELYLVDAPEDVQAVGIENPELYRANYEAYREVYRHQDAAFAFLEGLERRLSRSASKVFSPELRSMVQEWLKFEAGQREFMPYVRALSVSAKKFADTDLELLGAQVEWPQLSRLLMLQSMERDLDLEKGRAQKREASLAMRKAGVSDEVVSAVEALEERKITMNRLDPADQRLENLPRHLIERLLLEGAPKGFRLADYPDFALYAGYFILKSEVDSIALFEEIERLFEKILDRLARETSERGLLELFRDLELLKKFFKLEISREQWDSFQLRIPQLDPENFAHRVLAAETASASAPEVTAETAEAFQTAVRFYHLARQRDLVFHYRIKQGMTQREQDKSTLLTGGFHTQGVFERFRREEVNYGVLMPRITGDIDRGVYVKTMLETHPSMFKSATVEQPPLAASFKELEALGVQQALRAVLWPLQAAIETNLKYWLARGVNKLEDYYDAGRFAANFNDSLMARLRGARIVFTSNEQTQAYLYSDGKPVQNEAGDYLVLETVVVKDAAGSLVRVFGTHSRFIQKSPEQAGIPKPRFPRAPAEPSAEGPLSPEIQAELAKPVSVGSRAAVPSGWEALQAWVQKNPEIMAFLNQPMTLESAMNLLAALDLKAEFLAAADDKARMKIARRTASLVASGFGPPDEPHEDLSGLFAWIENLAQLALSPSARGLADLRTQAAQYASEAPGAVVTLRSSVLTADEVLGLQTQLALNPNLQLFFVVTTTEGLPQSELQTRLNEIRANILESLKNQGFENSQNRIDFKAVPENSQAVRTAIQRFYQNKIQSSQGVRSDDASASGPAFLIRAAESQANHFALSSLLDTLNAALLTQETLPKGLSNAASFVAGQLAQVLHLADKSMLEAVRLDQETVSGLQRQWSIDTQQLTQLQVKILALTQAMEAVMRLEASA